MKLYAMTHAAATFRFMLALIVGLGAPVWCCCAAEAEPTAAAVPACHHVEDVPPCHDSPGPHAPGDDDHDCACDAHYNAARFSPDHRIHVAAHDLAAYALDLPSPPVWTAQPYAADVMLLDTGPPPRPDTSLFDLHCMLTI